MHAFDALKAAESIINRMVIDSPASPLAGLVVAPTRARESSIEGTVISVERGIVELRDVHVGGTRRLIAPPMIAERLRRTAGIVTVIVDETDHVIGCIA